jgi:hypothetical protein
MPNFMINFSKFINDQIKKKMGPKCKVKINFMANLNFVWKCTFVSTYFSISYVLVPIVFRILVLVKQYFVYFNTQCVRNERETYQIIVNKRENHWFTIFWW